MQQLLITWSIYKVQVNLGKINHWFWFAFVSEYFKQQTNQTSKTIKDYTDWN